MHQYQEARAVGIRDRGWPGQAGGLTGLPASVILSWMTNSCTNMARTDIDKRSRLVSAAVDLAYRNGYGATSLADIAREAKVPLGNV
jgi:AcrR family transcriptional regulator